MKLEVGKSYRDRIGNIVEISDCFDQQPTIYPFVGSNSQRYAITGTWDIHAKTDKDLIEELIMLHLEVGKKYKNKSGMVVEIIKIDSQYGDFRYIGICSEGGYRRYRPDGEHANYTSADLIEEVEQVNMKLEVGKKYRNRNGDIVIIQSKSTLPCPYPFIGLELHTNTNRTYTESGRPLDHGESHDIVEEMNEGIKDKSFKTSQDAYVYLGAGGIIKNKSGNSIFYFENGDVYYECLTSGIRNNYIFNGIMFLPEPISNLEKYERPVIKNWYDDIPEQGILCMVKYRAVENGTISYLKPRLSVIVSYNGQFFVDNLDIFWDNATPATFGDLTQYVYDAK
jgi:hypothetical protein